MAYWGIFMKLSILMAAYNEERTIETIVEKILEVNPERISSKEIIIVDDGSTDKTSHILSELRDQHSDTIVALFHEKNKGKGAAIRTAIQHVTGDLCIIQDADLEYDPAEYPGILQPILDGKADCVYGSRFAGHGTRRVLYYWHSLGNKFLTSLSNCLTNLNLTDIETCYKAFRSSVLKTIPIRSNRFGIEPEITAKIAKRNLRIFEVPISYYGRTYHQGKKITWKDGIAAIYTIVKYGIIDDAFAEEYGQAILHDMQEAPNFSRWLIKLAEPYLGKVVLEVGSGIGNNVRMLAMKRKVIATDIDKEHINILSNAYMGDEHVEVYRWDVTKPWPDTPPHTDSIFCSNVLEHIDDEHAALVQMRTILKEQGRLILIVPQGSKLFCSLDEALGHFRRYSRQDLEDALSKAGFRIEHLFSFNKMGVLGWIIKGKILRANTLGRISLKLYNVSVWMFRIIDSFLPWRGLSWFVVASPLIDQPDHKTSADTDASSEEWYL